jgi:hypothetical protein
VLGSKYTISYASDSKILHSPLLKGSFGIVSELITTHRAHVLKDLQPYICTYSDCSLRDHLFESRDAWFSHEIKHHRIEFFCNVAGHKTYTEQTSFEIHLKQDHSIQLNNPSPALDVFRRPSQSAGGLCNLCFQHTKNLKSHVSRHLHQIALFAVPRAHYSVDDEELNGDPNVSEKNAGGSGSLGRPDAVSRKLGSSFDASEDPESVTVTMTAEKHEGLCEESVEQVEVPFIAEVNWDVVTEKFSCAREGHSDLAPISNALSEHLGENHLLIGEAKKHAVSGMKDLILNQG